MEEYGDWSSYGGYGLFCGRKCAAARKEAGIPPAAGKVRKQTEADAEKMLAQAAIDAQKIEDKSWSPLAVTGVVVASLLGIALMVVVIKKVKK